MIAKAANIGDLGLMALLLGLAGMAFVEAQGYAGGSAMFPQIVAGLLALIAAPSLVRSLIHNPLAPPGPMLRPVSLLGLLMAATTAAIFAFGHIAAAALVVAVSVTLMDRRRWLGALIAALLTTALVFVIFDLFQHVSWPRPIVLDWVAPMLSFR